MYVHIYVVYGPSSYIFFFLCVMCGFVNISYTIQYNIIAFLYYFLFNMKMCSLYLYIRIKTVYVVHYMCMYVYIKFFFQCIQELRLFIAFYYYFLPWVGFFLFYILFSKLFVVEIYIYICIYISFFVP